MTDFTAIEPTFDQVFSEPEPLPEEVQNGGPLAPWCLAPLVNIYREAGPCYLWLRFVPGWPDLEIQEYHDESHGKIPEWLSEAISESGLSSIMDLPWQGTMPWMLEQGLSPGQPFCIEVYPPHWTKVSYEYEEWDCDWYWDIVRVMPKTPRAVASSWERHLAAMRRAHQREEKLREQVRRKRLLDARALYLQWESYYSQGYCDDSPPGGLRVTLCTKHTADASGHHHFSHAIFSAESQDGHREEALEKLVERAYQEGLVVRSVWERLRKPWGGGILLSEEAFKKLPAKWP